MIDIALAILFALVLTTALVSEAPHEYLGVLVFVVAGVHIVLNRRAIASLFKIRGRILRVIQLIVIFGLVATLLGQVVSSLVLSKFAFAFLPVLPGASVARQMHLLCSYWSFVFAFAHVGLQMRPLAFLFNFDREGREKREHSAGTTWILRIVIAVVAVLGAVSFVQVGMAPYLLGQVKFAYADYGIPLALSFVRYASIAVLVTVLFAGVRLLVGRLDAKRKVKKIKSEY